MAGSEDRSLTSAVLSTKNRGYSQLFSTAPFSSSKQKKIIKQCIDLSIPLNVIVKFKCLFFDQFNISVIMAGLAGPFTHLIHKVIHSFCGKLFFPLQGHEVALFIFRGCSFGMHLNHADSHQSWGLNCPLNVFRFCLLNGKRMVIFHIGFAVENEPIQKRNEGLSGRCCCTETNGFSLIPR